MFGREDLDAHGLRHVEVRVGGHRASSISWAEPFIGPGVPIVCTNARFDECPSLGRDASERTAPCASVPE